MATAKRRNAAIKAWKTRRRALTPRQKSVVAEAASKTAFLEAFEKRGWRVAFFEGKTGSPRTGIIDAVAFKLGRRNADVLSLRLVQLKGGKAGIDAKEMGRLKKAAMMVVVTPMIAAYDGTTLQTQVLHDEIDPDS